MTSLRAGVPLVSMRRFSVSRFWPVVAKHGVTRLFALAAIEAVSRGSTSVAAPPATSSKADPREQTTGSPLQKQSSMRVRKAKQ